MFADSVWNKQARKSMGNHLHPAVNDSERRGLAGDWFQCGYHSARTVLVLAVLFFISEGQRECRSRIIEGLLCIVFLFWVLSRLFDKQCLFIPFICFLRNFLAKVRSPLFLNKQAHLWGFDLKFCQRRFSYVCFQSSEVIYCRRILASVVADLSRLVLPGYRPSILCFIGRFLVF